MSKGASYDTRFLVEFYYSNDENRKEAIREILVREKPNFLSVAAVSEIYKLTLEREGKDVAELRFHSLARDFRLVDIDPEIAIRAAVIKHRYSIPFADSLIASSALILNLPCYTDDPHFIQIDGLSLKWMR